MDIDRWLGHTDVALCVGEYMGLRAAHRCKVTSLASRRSLSGVCAKLEALFPSALYVCGSNDLNVFSAETFDLSTGLWRSIPQTLGNHVFGHVVAAAVAGKLFVAKIDSTAAEWYDPESKTWALLPPMLSPPRREVVHAVLGGKLYLCGGTWYMYSIQALNAAVRFDPDTVSWEALPSMLSGRDEAGIAAMGGNLYVCGGHGDDDECLHSVERFDPGTGSWEQLQPMCMGRGRPAMTVASDELYACGGCNSNSCVGNRCHMSLQSVERYDAAANTWEHLHSLSMPRHNPAISTFHRHIYVFGGRACGGDGNNKTGV